MVHVKKQFVEVARYAARGPKVPKIKKKKKNKRRISNLHFPDIWPIRMNFGRYKFLIGVLPVLSTSIDCVRFE